MASQAVLDLVMRLQSQTAIKGLDTMAVKTHGLGGIFSKVQGLAGGFTRGLAGIGQAAIGLGAVSGALGGVGDFLSSAVGEAREAVAGEEALADVLRTVGRQTGVTSEQVNRFAGSLQMATRFTDDQIKAGATQLTQIAHLSSTALPGASEAVLNFATRMKLDAGAAASELAGDLAKPEKGLKALIGRGVVFTKSQQDAVKAMTKAGNVAGAQSILLGGLETAFGGAARAAGQTAAGQMDIFSHKIGDLKEGLGNALLPVMNQFTGLLTSPAVLGAITAIGEGLTNGLAAGARFVGDALTTLMPVVQGVISALSGGFMSTVKTVAETLGNFAALLANAFSSGGARLDLLQALPSWLQPVGKIVGDITGNFGEFFTAITHGGDVLSNLGALIQNNLVDTLGNLGVPTEWVAGVQAAFGQVGATIQALAAGFAENGIAGAIDALGAKFTFLQGPIEVAKGALAALGGAFSTVVAAVQPFLEQHLDAVLFGLATVLTATLVPALLTTAATLVTTAIPAFVALAAPIVAAAVPIVALGAAATALYLAFQTNFGGLQTLVQPIFDGIGATVGLLAAAFGAGGLQGVVDLLGSHVQTNITVFENLKGVFQALQPVVEAARGIWNVVSAQLEKIGAQVMPQLQAAWIKMQPGITAISASLRDLAPVVVGIGEVIGAVLGGLVVATIGVVVGVFEGLVGSLVGLGMAFSGVFETIHGVLQVFGSFFGGIVSLVDDLIHGRFTQVFSDAGAIVSGMAVGIINIVKGLWDTVSGLFTGALGFITGLIDGATNAIVGIFNSLSDTLVGHSIIPDMLNMILGAFTGMVGPLLDTVSGLVGNVTGLFSTAWTTIQGVFSGAGEAMGAIGAHLIGGLISGVQGAWNGLMEMIRNLAQSLPQPIKDILGIHSDSDVTTQLGEHITGGLITGIVSGQGTLTAALTTMSTGILTWAQTTAANVLAGLAPLVGIFQAGLAPLLPAWLTVFGDKSQDGTMLNSLFRNDGGFFQVLSEQSQGALALYQSTIWIQGLEALNSAIVDTLHDTALQAASEAQAAGNAIGASLANGLYSQVATVRAAAQALADAARPPVGSGGGAGGGTGSSSYGGGNPVNSAYRAGGY